MGWLMGEEGASGACRHAGAATPAAAAAARKASSAAALMIACVLL